MNALGVLRKGRFDGWVVAWKGYLRGRRARYLPAVDDWDRLLRLPLEEWRAELDVSPLAPYRPRALDDVFGRVARNAS